jgi:hypothetical protein
MHAPGHQRWFVELRVGQMLPDIGLRAANGGVTIPLRSARGETTVIFWRHPFNCADCDRYLATIADSADEFRVWEARLLVLACPGAGSKPVPFGIVAENGQLALAGSGLLVADRYGQIFYVAHADSKHVLPPPRELVE